MTFLGGVKQFSTLYVRTCFLYPAVNPEKDSDLLEMTSL